MHVTCRILPGQWPPPFDLLFPVQLARAATLDVNAESHINPEQLGRSGLDLIDNMLDETGVAYEVLTPVVDLTPDFLEGSHGRFNGVILTDAFVWFHGSGQLSQQWFLHWKSGSCCIGMTAISKSANPSQISDTRLRCVLQDRL